MSTVYHDEQHESILWHPSEVLTDIDLNYAQRLRDRRVLDHLMASLFTDPGSSEDTGEQYRPIGAAFSQIEAAAPAMSVVVRAGALIWQQAADPGSPSARRVLHRMASDLVVAIDAADPANDRIDVLSYKLEYDAEDVGGVGPDVESRIVKIDDTPTFSSSTPDKRRRTLLTVTYTPGVPAASPVAPDPPAGEAKFAEVYVDAAAVSIGTDKITDFRTPAGATTVIVPMASGRIGSNWTWAPTIGGFNSSAAGELDFDWTQPGILTGKEQGSAALWTTGARHVRLRSVVYVGKISSPGTAELWHGVGQFNSPAAALALTIGHSSGLFTTKGATPTTPLWSNGQNGPSYPNAAFDRLYLRFNSGALGASIQGARLHFYGF